MVDMVEAQKQLDQQFAQMERDPRLAQRLSQGGELQRGFMITFAASVNRARERACGSVIPAKADGARSSVLS